MLLAHPLFWAGEAVAQAPAMAAGSVAGSIGKGLGSAVAGQAAGVALGQLMAVAGVDLSGEGAKLDQITAQLRQVLQQLEQLQQKVDALKSAMERSFLQLSQDVALQAVVPLINANSALLDDFSSLARAGRGEIVAFAKRFQASGLDDMKKGPYAWHNALVGESGQTAILRISSNQVLSRCGPLYGPATAQAMQSRWDYLDAQQALTVLFAVEHYNATRMPERAKKALRTWGENRTRQLAQLRGGTQLEYQVTTLDDAGQPKQKTVRSPSLPRQTLIERRVIRGRPIANDPFEGRSLMWHLQASGAVPAHVQNRQPVHQIGDDAPAWAGVIDRAASEAEQLVGPHFYAFRPQPNLGLMRGAPNQTWNPTDSRYLIQLMEDCGENMAFQKACTPEKFGPKMAAAGFRLPNGPLRLWTTQVLGGDAGARRMALADGCLSSLNDPATASLLLARVIEKDELYWYDAA